MWKLGDYLEDGKSRLHVAIILWWAHASPLCGQLFVIDTYQACYGLPLRVVIGMWAVLFKNKWLFFAESWRSSRTPWSWTACHARSLLPTSVCLWTQIGHSCVCSFQWLFLGTLDWLMLVQKCCDELLHVAYFFRYSEFKAGLQATQQLRAKDPDPQKLADTGRQAADSLLQV